ncbi:hypothetical protein DFH06DRAFT_1332411 [Mycena polygramma]|nr:hypothetical protein DFH06DRAFT_1332411 [Mycena polygramma]
MIPLLLSTVWLLSFQVVAQQAVSTWRKPNVTTSRADRVNLAEAAIKESIAQLDTSTAQFPDAGDSYGFAGAFYSQLAEFDLATNQSKYGSILEQYFLLATENLGQYGAENFTGEYVSQMLFKVVLMLTYIALLLLAQMNDGINYGHGAVMAFTAYSNTLFLDYARQVWWAVEPYTLSQKDVDTGTIPLKNFTMITTCTGLTMAGGTFRVFEKDPNAPDMNAQSTGNFLVLSALLAEATGEDIFLDAAKASADFFNNHLLNAQHIAQDGISARTNDSCSPSPIQVSYNSALLLEGLAILYSITSNASISAMIEEILTAAIPNPAWQGPDGIIANGATKLSDLMMPRALSTVISRNATTPALRSYIETYLSVQFNAVIDLATTSGSNIYSGTWNGQPSATAFSPGNQTNAIQVLVSAINLNNQTSPTESSNSSLPSSASPTPSGALPSASTSLLPPVRKASMTGAIVGGSIGGLLLLIGGAIGIILWRRRLRFKTTPSSSVMAIAPQTNPAIRPFDLQFSDPPQPRSTKLNHSIPAASLAQVSANQNDGLSTPVSAALPTSELVNILYQRLANHELVGSDEPPDYPATPRP